MKKLAMILALAAFAFAEVPVADTTKVPVKVTETSLTPFEKALAGVLLLSETYNISATKKHEFYLKLLKESKISHAQFQTSLKACKATPKEWQKTLERLKSALE